MLPSKAVLILIHYLTNKPKIWAETEILDPKEHPELAKKWVIEDYKAVVEKLVIYHIKAFD